MVRKQLLTVAALGGLIALQACTSGQSAVEPTVTQANLNSDKLQFAVGTANRNGAIGLNTVETFRQPNGLSAVLVSTPTITGPAGFLVPAGFGGNNGGTNTISASPQAASATPVVPTTFSNTGGAFGYGFAPDNIGPTGANLATGLVSFSEYSLPFYVASSSKTPYYIGPGSSSVPNYNDGTQAPGFVGYSSGFVDFAGVTLALGTYGLSVNVPTANTAAIPNFTASGTLTTLVPLPVIPAPVFTSDGAGGGTISVTIPAGVTEALVYVRDTTSGNNYTLLTRTSGPQAITLPDNIGPIAAKVAGPTASAGDTLSIDVVGFDYPAIEAAEIGAAPAVAPVITGANGQADITVSPKATGTE